MRKLKSCKACSQEISKRAKSCPSCGEPVRKSFFSKMLRLFVLMTFAIAFVAITAGLKSSGKKKVMVKKVKTKTQILAEKKANQIKRVKEKENRKIRRKNCNIIYKTMLETINAGASVMTVSKGASDLYDKVYDSTSECAYIRYAFRTLRKPYEGERVSPKDWDSAIKRFILKRE